jgi:hypothetical protein
MVRERPCGEEEREQVPRKLAQRKREKGRERGLFPT